MAGKVGLVAGGGLHSSLQGPFHRLLECLQQHGDQYSTEEGRDLREKESEIQAEAILQRHNLGSHIATLLPHTNVRGKSLSLTHIQQRENQALPFEGRSVKNLHILKPLGRQPTGKYREDSRMTSFPMSQLMNFYNLVTSHFCNFHTSASISHTLIFWSLSFCRENLLAFLVQFIHYPIIFKYHSIPCVQHWKYKREKETTLVLKKFVNPFHNHIMYAHSIVSDSLRPHGLQSARFLCAWNFPGKNTGVGCHFLLQGIFPRVFNQCLLRQQANSLPLVPPEKPSPHNKHMQYTKGDKRVMTEVHGNTEERIFL